MDIFIASLAVYKVIQIIDSLSPREAMPWVKILVGAILGYLSGWVIGVSDLHISGLAIATLSGTVHSVLRWFTLNGDASHRRSMR